MNYTHIAKSTVSNTYARNIAWKNYDTNTKFISVNTFWGGYRKISHIYSIEALYVDLDLYNVEEIWNNIQNIHYNNFNKEGSNKDEVLKIQHDYIISLVNYTCLSNNIPAPTKINFSGRGYNVFWELKGKDGYSGIHGSCHNVWKLVNTKLVDLFKTLGADSAANDIARVFKIMGELNHKSGFSAEEVYSNDNKYDFKIFSNELLDYTQEETIEYKKQLATAKQIKFINDLMEELNIEFEISAICTKKEADRLIKELKAKKPCKVFYNTNSNATLNTLNKQLKLGNIKDGNRSVFLHRYSIGLKLNKTPKAEAKNKIIQLAQKINFPEKEAISCFEQGYNNSDCTTGLNTNKMLVDLGITSSPCETKDIKTAKQTRTSNKKINYKTLRHIILMNNDMSLSARKLASKYNIGKTKAAELLNYMRTNKARLMERNKVSVKFVNMQKNTILKGSFENMVSYSNICNNNMRQLTKSLVELLLEILKYKGEVGILVTNMTYKFYNSNAYMLYCFQRK